MAEMEIKSSEITPESVYLNRRNFIRGAALAGTTLATAGVYRYFNPPPPKEIVTAEIQNITKAENFRAEDAPNSFEDITNYNNFYEFSTSKTAVARKAQDFVTSPWSIEVGGLVQKPKVFGFEELLKFEQEERIYRFRCVEGWSMVIPWVGFPLKKLLDAVVPMGTAKYAAFQTFYDGANPTGAEIKLPAGANQMQSCIFRRNRISVCRRFAARRGVSSFDNSGDRTLRQADAEPERRAGASDRALEIRF